MNYYLISFLVLVLPYAFVSIFYDIRDRKIPNYINLSFLYISALVLAFFLTQFGIIDYLIIIGGLVLGYFFYKKGYWGGADGKIYFALTFLILSLGNYSYYLDFLLNLALFYSLSMIFLVMFRTSIKSKIEILKEINYLQQIFQILIIFILIRDIFRRYVSTESSNYSYFIILIFVLILVINPILRRFFRKLKTSTKLTLIGILATIFIYLSDFKLMKYFILILIFRILLNFVSESTTKIKHHDGVYESPFSIYLFVSAIFTIIGGNNVINIVLKFLF